MATSNPQDEEKVHSLQLPPPQKETTLATAKPLLNLQDADLEMNKDDDIRTLKAKLKGFQTLGKLYREERDKCQQLIQANQNLTAQIEALQNSAAAPQMSLDQANAADLDLNPQQLTKPSEELTEHGHAGHSMTPPPSEGQGQPEVSSSRMDTGQADKGQGALRGASPGPASEASSGSFDWELADDTTTVTNIAALAKEATKAYTAMDGPEPDYSKLFSSLEKCVQKAAPGLGSDLIRLSLQALKNERNDRVKQTLMTNMKTQLTDQDKRIKQLKEQLKASDQGEKEDWINVDGETTESVEALKRRHAEEVTLLRQQLDDMARFSNEENIGEYSQQMAALKDELTETKRLLENEKVALIEARRALEDEMKHAAATHDRNEMLNTKIAHLKRQRREDEQIIEALTNQNRSLRVYPHGSEEAEEKLKVEIEVLKQQVTIYKEDFDQERSSREEAHSEKEALETSLRKLKDDFKHAQQEVVRSRQRVQELEDEKREIHKLKREKGEELRAARQQVDVLQGQLRKIEEERRRWHTAMYTPPAYYLQQQTQSGASAKKWTCRLCTYINDADARQCAICHEKAPLDTPTMKPPYTTWMDLQCDHPQPLPPNALVSRDAPLEPGGRSPGSPPPHAPPDTPDVRNKRHPAKPY